VTGLDFTILLFVIEIETLIDLFRANNFICFHLFGIIIDQFMLAFGLFLLF
jgi:hypothetical protein